MGRSDAHLVLPSLDLVCSADRTLASLGELPLGPAPPPLLLRRGPARAPPAVSVVQPSGRASPALLVLSGGGNKMV